MHDWDAHFSATEIEENIDKVSQKPCVFETLHRRKDGSVVDVEISSKTVIHKGYTLFWCAARDIGDRKKTEARLRLAANVFTHARESIIITDAAGTMLEVNDTFVRITGYSRNEAIGKNPRILQSGRQSREFYVTMWKSLLETGQWSGEIWNRRKDGTLYIGMMTIGAVKNSNELTQYYVALFTDITQMKEHEWWLEHIAHYDPLTTLPNRVLLADRLRQAMIHSQRNHQILAVVFIDLDGFKAINDEHGHDAGDEFLIAIAKRMKKVIREGDSLARFGGDEFVAIISNLERPNDCEPLLMRLLQDIAKPIQINKINLQVSGSIGVAFYPQSASEADQLIRQADQAMYAAKQAGKNRFQFFDLNQDLAIKSLRNSLDEIRQGLQKNQFVLFYQPKVNMKTGEVIGAEALLRWNHPERGLQSPAAFLPLIEDHPLNIKMGEWVIESALEQIHQWNQQGIDMKVSVNVGGQQLLHDTFVAHIDNSLARYPEVRSEQLELEILETSALEDIAKASSIMNAVRNLGVTFALDDFGTGFSSLSFLKSLPAAFIKIDQSFVRNVLVDSQDLAIVNGVISLAKAFRRKVIAEGVETIEHGELLLPFGCELAQGYGIAKPMPAELVPDWIENWQPDAKWTIWNNITPNQDHLTMVFAEVEQRAWFQQIKNYLNSEALVPLSLSERVHHFEHWQQIVDTIREESRLELLILLNDHHKTIQLGKSLAELHFYGKKHKTDEMLSELTALHDELIAKLKRTRCSAVMSAA